MVTNQMSTRVQDETPVPDRVVFRCASIHRWQNTHINNTFQQKTRLLSKQTPNTKAQTCRNTTFDLFRFRVIHSKLKPHCEPQFANTTTPQSIFERNSYTRYIIHDPWPYIYIYIYICVCIFHDIVHCSYR